MTIAIGNLSADQCFASVVAALLLLLSVVSCSNGDASTVSATTTTHQTTTRTFHTSSAGLATVFQAVAGMGAGDIGSHFHDDALVAGVEIVDCTLENRSETQCYQLLASSQPGAIAVTGPFCPSTVTDEHGIFTWGGENPGLYALNEEFWEMVTALGYSFVNEDGTINVADPGFSVPGRGDVCLEATPDVSYTLKMLIPVTPEDLDAPTQLSTVSQIGVALDGATIFGDAPTGNAIPALDPCGGHNDPSGYYHWHFGPDSIQENLDAEEIKLVCGHTQDPDTLVGFAYDGYAIYGLKDLDIVPTDLDACSGHTGETPEFGTVYHYHLNYESPNLPGCRTGATAQGKLTSPDNPDVTLPDGMGMGPGREPGGAGVGPGADVDADPTTGWQGVECD